MKFRFVVTVDSPSAPPEDRDVWGALLKGVSKDQSKVFIVAQPVAKVWFTLLGGGPITIHEGAPDDMPHSTYAPVPGPVVSVDDLERGAARFKAIGDEVFGVKPARTFGFLTVLSYCLRFHSGRGRVRSLGHRKGIMKFSFLVSGVALSDAQMQAIRDSIEDLAAVYKRPDPFIVRAVPHEWSLALDDVLPDSPPLPYKSTVPDGSPLPWPCHSLPRDQWCDHSGPGDFMGHTCGFPGGTLSRLSVSEPRLSDWPGGYSPQRAKSARGPLMTFRYLWLVGPQYVVVFLFVGFMLGLLVGNLLKAWGS